MKISDILAHWEFDAQAPPELVLVEPFLWREEPAHLALLSETSGQVRLIVRFERDDGSWTVGERQPRLCFSLPSSPTLDDLREITRQALKNERMCRVFPGLGNVRIAPNGVGVWFHERLLHNLRVTGPPDVVRFCLGRRISKIPASQTREWLANLLLRSSSDSSFARAFSRCNPSQKRQQAFGFATEEEAHHACVVLEWLCVRVLRCEAALWNGAPQIAWSLMSGNGRRSACFYYFRDDGAALKPTPRLDWWARVLEQFGPLQPHKNRLCVRDWLLQSPLLASGQLEAPTSHEQLEARLELRDWAQTHLPPDVRAELERHEL